MSLVQILFFLNFWQYHVLFALRYSKWNIHAWKHFAVIVILFLLTSCHRPTPCRFSSWSASMPLCKVWGSFACPSSSPWPWEGSCRGPSKCHSREMKLSCVCPPANSVRNLHRHRQKDWSVVRQPVVMRKFISHSTLSYIFSRHVSGFFFTLSKPM